MEIGVDGVVTAHAQSHVVREHRKELVLATILRLPMVAVHVLVQVLKLNVVKLKSVKIFAQEKDGV